MQHEWVKTQKNLDTLERFGPGWYVSETNEFVYLSVPCFYAFINFAPKEYGNPKEVIRTKRVEIERRINHVYLTCFWFIDFNLGKASIVIKSENKEVNAFFSTVYKKDKNEKILNEVKEKK